MDHHDLEEFFGLPVLVQLEEPVPVVVPAQRDPQQAPKINQIGKPEVMVGPQGPMLSAEKFWPPETKVSDGSVEFAAYMVARIMPASTEGRTILLYETTSQFGKHIVSVSVRTKDIISVSRVQETMGEGEASPRLVKP